MRRDQLVQRMYEAAMNSVATGLVVGVDAVAVGLAVADATVLPQGPNLATIGDGDDAELVYYAAIEGDVLAGCVRGFYGTVARDWPQGAPVYRAYTAYDHDAFVGNIEGLGAGKLDVGGDASAATAAFEAAQARDGLQSGLSLAGLFGRVKRWLSDLRAAAFMDVGTAAGTVAAGDHAHAGYALAARGEDIVLMAEGWEGGVYIVESELIASADTYGRVALAMAAEAAEAEAFARARVRTVAQEQGLLCLGCMGAVPEIAIPVRLEVIG